MSGHSSPLLSKQILWPDAEIKEVVVDYDSVKIVVREATGSVKEVRCEGYIGYRVIGFWDEVVVERAEIKESGEMTSKCIEQLNSRLGQNWIDSGSPARNGRSFAELKVILGDGALLEVVAAKFTAGPMTAPLRRS